MAKRAEGERYYERWTPVQRVQHVLLIISFTTLVVTGLPVLFSNTPPAAMAIRAVGGMAMRGYIHRAAALLMIMLAIFHAGYVVFSRRGHDELLALMPEKKDLKDAIGMLRFYVGLARHKPRFDRYNFIEKLEYLSLAWGTVVMVVTGALLWFEDQAMLVFPKWVLDICDVVHGREALLAFLAIAVWHLYHVHLNPEVFPMSRIRLDGKISESELREHHPIEYERIKAAEKQAERQPETVSLEEFVRASVHRED
jgi:formate dehydrogenase gamma subunit